MEKKLQFKRVENPEGWKSPDARGLAYICTNIRRDAAAWWIIDSTMAEESMKKFVDLDGDYAVSFHDKEGKVVARPTPDEIIWPRFTAVEVEGGWSVLDRWENERHKNVGTRENTETTLRMLADGRLTKQQGSGWIPYVPTPIPKPEPRYIEIAVEGGKSIYDTVTKQRRHHIWFNDDELKEVLDKWNDGMMGNPNDRGSKFLWIPHEQPAPAPGPQYIACQHQGKWEGDFLPKTWGVVRNSDDCWTDFGDEPLAGRWANGLTSGELISPDCFTWHPRKVDDHKQPESQTQETSANNQDKPKYERGWYVNDIGQLRFIVGFTPSGDFVVQTESKILFEVSKSKMDGYKYKPVPECTGWDWKPKLKMRPKTLADCLEGVWVTCETPSRSFDFYQREGNCSFFFGTLTGKRAKSQHKPESLLVHPPEEVPDSQ